MSTAAGAFLAASGAAAGVLALRRRLRATPPRAKRVPHVVRFGEGATDAAGGGGGGARLLAPPVELIDDLFWLRDDERKDPAVLAHLRAENAYTETATAGLPVDALYRELLSRVKETDATAPYRHGRWLYYTRTEAGRSYAIRCRAPAPAPAAGDGAGGVAAAAAVETAGFPHVEKAAGGGGGGGGEQQQAQLPGEEVVLDENALAAGNPMLDVAAAVPSPDHTLLAYTVDTSGYETYTIRVKQLGAGAGAGASPPLLPDVLEGSNGEVAWDAAGLSLFYLTMDEQHRPCKLWRHVLGTPQGADACLVTEPDERFWLGMHKTLSGDFLVVDAASKTTSEVRLVALTDAATGGALRAGDPASAPRLVAPREEGELYEVEHWRPHPRPAHPAHPAPAGGDGGWLVLLTNRHGAKNFSVCAAPAATPGREHWRVVVPHSAEIYLTGVEVFGSFWALHGRTGGYKNTWVVQAADVAALLGAPAAAAPLPPADAPGASGALVQLLRVPSRDAVYVVAAAGGNMDYAARALRFTYSSPVTPSCTCEFRVPAPAPARATGVAACEWAASVTVLKQKSVPNCDPRAYATARVHAAAPDGTRVPVSLLWRRDAHAAPGADGLPRGAPTLLYGYGAYGHSIDMHFSASVLSLADRGVLYAVAHVRGGGELGRAWYEDGGKMLTKTNTFGDFIACAEHLVASGCADPKRVAAQGASAGGLLVGAVVNRRPDLWCAALSQVGFVDVLVTMSDASIPLTVAEYEEWGNPHEERFHSYMAAYSPMENVRPCALPALLLTCGLNDSRVAYWEVAKFAQRLRDANTGPRQVLLKADLGAGHFSYSDRYAHLRETAFEYAWLLRALGVAA